MPAFLKTKKFLAVAAVVLAGLVFMNWSRFVKPNMRDMKEKVIILGFDGMDPKLLQQYMGEGDLPHFKQLADQGQFVPLGTTNPPESPVAWASFQTGVNPGGHNIYDFLTRSTETYLPNLGMVIQEPPEFLWKLIPIKMPHVEPMRKGTPFWVQTGNAGVRTTVLTVPLSYPPDDIHGGYMLAGLPLPDIRGTNGTFYYWATDLSDLEVGDAEMGGKIGRLEFNGDTAKTVIVGPASPLLKAEQDELRKIPKDQRTIEQQARYEELMGAGYKDIKLDMTVKKIAGGVHVHVQDNDFDLKKRAWTDWQDFTFKITPIVRIHGMAQFYLVEDQPEVKLYMSPINWDPRNPPLPITKPDGWSKDLVDEVGMYRTLGWAEATWPLNEERIDEATFIEDAYRAMDDRMKIMEHELNKKNWNLFVSVYETTDRFQHMFYRLIDPQHPYYDAELAAKYGNAIRDCYIRADKIVGKAMEHADANTTLMVVSDHGFHTFRKAVNLNTWLVLNGYMKLIGQEEDSPQYKLATLFDKGQFWVNTDWSKTKAYAMGLGQIYINLQGREKFGIVSPGDEYAALQNELVEKLMQFKDPDTGETMIDGVYKRDDIYHGAYIGNAPDLMIGFHDGYRVSWQTTLGGIPKNLVDKNMKKWSGDHCSFDYRSTSGVFLINRKISKSDPKIVDIAPTVYKILNVPPVAGLDGSPLF
jgi:predicted AlkP superfamily phosphohydrolase/phosphomutase